MSSLNLNLGIAITSNLLSSILSAYVVYEYYRTFFEVRSERIRVWMAVILYIGWQSVFLASICDIPAILGSGLSIMFVALIGGCFIGSTLGKIIFAIMYYTIRRLNELLICSIFLNARMNIEDHAMLGSFICEFLLLILVKGLHLFFHRDDIYQSSWGYQARFMLILMGCMFFASHLLGLSAKSGNPIDIWISVIAIVALLIIIFVMFLLYIRLMDSYEIKRKCDIYKQELELYTEHMKEKESTMEEFRKLKHDFKHKLFYLLELVKRNNYGKLEKYVEELIELQSAEGLMIANTDHFLIDAQVNFKYREAEKHGIEFKANLDIPSSMPFDDADLCVILGNALDNALEANIDYKVKNPYVNLKMKYKGDSLIIILENSFNGIIKKDHRGRLLTQKENKKDHGFGLNSIKNELLKYHGYMDIDIDATVFKLTLIMYQVE